MTIMSIIITEEDLCKKHAKKCAKICQFSSLPSKCFQAANDPNTKNDSKPHPILVLIIITKDGDRTSEDGARTAILKTIHIDPFQESTKGVKEFHGSFHNTQRKRLPAPSPC